MTGVEWALLLLGTVMLAASSWVYNRTRSAALVTLTVLAFLGLAYMAGLIV